MNRTTQLLIGLLVVLAAITYFIIPSGGERELSYESPELSLKIDSASVVKVELQRPSKSVVIENIGGKWSITSPMHSPADPGAVTGLINSLAKLRIGSLISSNPEKQHLFQVDSMGTMVTVVERGGNVVSLIVGKMGPSFSEVYLRLPTSKDVYLAEGLDSWTVTKDVKDWRDRTILTMPSDAIKELSYTSNSRHYTFHRDSTGWSSGNGPIESSAMNPTLNTLSNLRAEDFVDSTFEAKTQPITIGVQGLTNASITLYPVLPDSAKYVVQSSSASQTFVINKWTAQQMLKPIEKHGLAAKQVAEVKRPPITETPAKEIVTAPPPITTPPKTTPPTSTEKRGTTKSVVREPEVERPTVREERQPTPTRQQQKPSTPTTTAPTTQRMTIPDDEGDLVVHTVQRGETMQTIAKKYNTTVEKILGWNLLKSIAVKPGQELYIYVKK